MLKGLTEFLPSLLILHWMRRVCYHGSGFADKYFGLLSRYLYGTNEEFTTAGELTKGLRDAVKKARGKTCFTFMDLYFCFHLWSSKTFHLWISHFTF